MAQARHRVEHKPMGFPTTEDPGLLGINPKANGGPASQAPTGALWEINAILQNLAARLRMTNDKSELALDRIFGSGLPPQSASKTDRPLDQTVLGSISEIIGEIQYEIAKTENLSSRLNELA